MNEKSQIDILKGAILLEHRGKALFESVVKTTEIEEVKELFLLLVKEEEKHIAVLKKWLIRLRKGRRTEPVEELDKLPHATAEAVLSRNIVDKIHGAGYEAAVISAGLDFEKNAVKYYSEQAAEAESKEDKALYKWLAEWETQHMELMAGLDEDLREKIWFDNQFWPLD